MTMEQLIKISEHDGRNVVSARDLHSFLESKKQFADWIKHRIKKYGLIGGHDYVIISPSGEKPLGGRPTIEFALTLDAAKELSMVEGNAKGKQARQYFIECERRVKSGPVIPQLSRLELLEMALESERKAVMLEERVNHQQKELQIAAPKVQYVNEVLSSHSTITTTVIAKELGMGAPTLNRILKERRVQYYHNGTWVLFHQYQNKGYAKTRTHTFTDAEGKERTSIHMVWTEAGRMFIHSLIKGKLKSA